MNIVDPDSILTDIAPTSGTIPSGGGTVDVNFTKSALGKPVGDYQATLEFYETNDVDAPDLSVQINLAVIEPITEVHIFFTPPANSGSGQFLYPFGLNPSSSYTFTAEDQSGNDITSEVTFILEGDDNGDDIFNKDEYHDPSRFLVNVLTTRGFGFGIFRVVGVYRMGTIEEVRSDPDYAGEERYFIVTL